MKKKRFCILWNARTRRSLSKSISALCVHVLKVFKKPLKLMLFVMPGIRVKHGQFTKYIEFLVLVQYY